MIAILPGSRRSETLRHVPELRRAAEILSQERKLSFLLPASPVCGAAFFEGPLAGSPIRAIEGEAWDAMAHCDVALAASGTVTVEAALLGVVKEANHLTLAECRDLLAERTGVRVHPWTVGRALRRRGWT